MIFPFLNGQDGAANDKENTELPMYKEIDWDFENDKAVIENGDFKIVPGNRALKIWIYKAINTDRFALNIYSWNYGSDVNSLVGKGYSKDFTITESKRYIKEALLQNEYIKSVTVKEIVFNDDKLSINADIETVYGKMNVNL